MVIKIDLHKQKYTFKFHCVITLAYAQYDSDSTGWFLDKRNILSRSFIQSLIIIVIAFMLDVVSNYHCDCVMLGAVTKYHCDCLYVGCSH